MGTKSFQAYFEERTEPTSGISSMLALSTDGASVVKVAPTVFNAVDHNVLTTRTGTQNATALATLIDLANGTPIVFPAGVYDIETMDFDLPDGGVRLWGPAATLRHTSTTNYMMLADGAYGTHYTISSIATNTSYTYDSGTSASTVSVLTVSATPSELAAGDVVKVYSTDEITNARPGTGGTARRRGEFAVVVAISGNDVYLSAKLKDTYTTSPKVVKMDNRPFEMSGFSLDMSDDAFASTAFQGMFRLRGLYKPVFNDIKVIKARGPALQLMGAYQPIVNGLTGGNLNGNTVDGQYGYMLEDIACEGGRYSGLAGHFLRHVLTTNTYDVLTSVSADLLATYCGKTRQAVVSNSVAFGCFNSGFDVHEESEGVHFSNCHTRNTIEGRESQGSGFNLRSQSCTTYGCTSENDNIGITIHEAYPGSTTGGAGRLVGMEVRNARKKAVEIATYNASTRVSGLIIEGGYFHAVEGPALDINDADVETIGGSYRSDTGVVVKIATGTVLKQTDPLVVATDNACVDTDATSSYEHVRGEFRGGQSGQIFTSSTGALYKCSGIARFALLGSSASAAIYRAAQDQTVKWPDGASIDLSDFSGTNPRIFRAAGTGVTIKAKGISIKRGSAGNPVLVDGGSNSGLTATLKAVEIDGNAASGFGDYDTTNLHANAAIRISRKADNNTTELITTPFTSGAPTPTLTFGYNGEGEFTLYCTLANSGQSYTMPDWPAGLDGQRMHVVVNPTGATNTLALAHGGTTNRLNNAGGTVTLTGDNYNATTYVFAASKWRQIVG